MRLITAKIFALVFTSGASLCGLHGSLFAQTDLRSSGQESALELPRIGLGFDLDGRTDEDAWRFVPPLPLAADDVVMIDSPSLEIATIKSFRISRSCIRTAGHMARFALLAAMSGYGWACVGGGADAPPSDGDIPSPSGIEVGGEGVISTDRNQTFPAEDPRGEALWFSVYDDDFDEQTIMVARTTIDGWSAQEVAPFSGTSTAQYRRSGGRPRIDRDTEWREPLSRDGG